MNPVRDSLDASDLPQTSLRFDLLLTRIHFSLQRDPLLSDRCLNRALGDFQVSLQVSMDRVGDNMREVADEDLRRICAEP